MVGVALLAFVLGALADSLVRFFAARPAHACHERDFCRHCDEARKNDREDDHAL